MYSCYFDSNAGFMFFYIGKRINIILMKFENKYKKYVEGVEGRKKRRESKSNNTIIISTNFIKMFPHPPLLVPHNFGICVACTFQMNSREPKGPLEELHRPRPTSCKGKHHSENCY